MSDLQFNEYNCICGTKTFLKKDGTPWKHQTPQGAHCFGSSDPEIDLTDVKESGFSYSISVYANNPMIGEFEWEVNNLHAAAEAAEKAGHFVTGEAALVSEKAEGPKIRYTYEVPVKEG